MLKIKFLLIIGIASLACSCGPTPQELAEESKRLHREIEQAKTKEDSARIWNEISLLETEANNSLDKEELKEYRKLAHPR